jgi:hypothetical protein
MSTSTDGGLTWATALNPEASTSAVGIGGQPLVQPNGTVIVPFFQEFVGSIESFSSGNGGASWTLPIQVARSPAIRLPVDCVPTLYLRHKLMLPEPFTSFGKIAPSAGQPGSRLPRS